MKKLMSMLLAVALVCGLSVNAFALKKISDIKPAFDISDYVVHVTSNGKTKVKDPKTLANYDATPGDIVKVYLTPDIFVDSSGATIRESADEITKTSNLSSGKISVRRTTSKGKDIIKSVSLKNDKKYGAYIEVKFVDYFVSTEEKDYKLTLYLTVKSKKVNSTALDISGTMSNNVIEVDSGDDYVNISEGEVAEAQDYIRSIDVDLGSGVILTTSMSRNGKYYGVVDATPTTADEKIMDLNSSVVEVFNVKTINLKKTGKVVSFDIDYTGYVYDSTGKYLGTTREKVAYSTKYYISDKKVTALKMK